MSSRAFFDRHARSWDESDSPEMRVKLARVVEESGAQPGDRVLDVGTGTGVLIPRILEAVGPTGYILALDVSLEMLSVASRKGFPANVEFREADAQRTGLPDSEFDRVICNAAFPHFSDKEQALAEMNRVLRPGGSFIISHPIGREAVNNLHIGLAEVAEDRVPTAEKMRDLLEGAGFVDTEVTDERDYYSAVARKRVSFGRRWRQVTSEVSYDDSTPKTRTETLRVIEAILATNGGFVFPLNATNVVLLTQRDLEELGQPLPR